jgi:hypothetical protein
VRAGQNTRGRATAHHLDIAIDAFPILLPAPDNICAVTLSLIALAALLTVSLEAGSKPSRPRLSGIALGGF